MSARLVALAYDVRDPGRVAQFWGAMLDRPVVPDPRGVLLPGSPTQVGLRFTATTTPRVGRDQVHLHLTSDTPADQQATVARALDLGATHLDVGQRPEDGHVVLADPEGHELCVIEAGNRFLAGCGPLGELACEGTRAVGVFWSAVLGWPLVWDQDEETAVQSPHGGTKVAWGGPPLTPRQGRAWQRLEVAATTGDHAAEVDRLVGLGATRIGEDGAGGTTLADPDGNELVLVQPISP